MQGRTVIIIAHRLSTVEKADRIVVIDKGQVMEEGSHQELLQSKGMYSTLVKRQLLLSSSSWSNMESDSEHTNEQINKCNCNQNGVETRKFVAGALQETEGNVEMFRGIHRGRDRIHFIVGSV